MLSARWIPCIPIIELLLFQCVPFRCPVLFYDTLNDNLGMSRLQVLHLLGKGKDSEALIQDSIRILEVNQVSVSYQNTNLRNLGSSRRNQEENHQEPQVKNGI